MQITFDLPHVFYPGSSDEENSYVLRGLLEMLIYQNLGYLRSHNVPSLYRSGVTYGRTTIWEGIPALYKRGYGDCKSLTAALIAEYRKAGKRAVPTFRWKPRPDGYKDWHILVQTADGFEDPSKMLGMGKNENARW
jgi:hypothetical protein